MSVTSVSSGRFESLKSGVKQVMEERGDTMRNVLSDGMQGPYSKGEPGVILPLELQIQAKQNQMDNNRGVENVLRPIASQMQSVRDIHEQISSVLIKLRAPSQIDRYPGLNNEIDKLVDELTSILNQKSISGSYSMSGTFGNQQSVINLTGLTNLSVGGTLAATDYYQGGPVGGDVIIDGNGIKVQKAPVTAGHEGIRLLLQGVLKARNLASAPDRDALLSEAINDIGSSGTELGKAMAQVSVPLKSIDDTNKRLDRESMEAKTNLGNMSAQGAIDGMLELKQQEVVQQIATGLLEQEATQIQRMTSILNNV